MLAGCPPPAAECGDGIVDEGETEATCCVDTGCSTGVCGARGACEDPWTSACDAAGAGACLPESSAVCPDAPTAIPVSDCTQCGCGGGDRCEDQVCVDVATRDAERDSPVPPNDLETTDFLALIAEANSFPLTFNDVVSAHRKTLREDRRALALLVGRIGNGSAPPSDDRVDEANGLEARIATRLVESLSSTRGQDQIVAMAGRVPTPFELSERDVVPLGETLDDACGELEAAAAAAKADETRMIVFADAAIAHRESCFYPALFPRCGHPHLDGCLEREGIRPVSVVVMSTALALDRLERALLVRIGNQQAFAIDTRLEQTITQWQDLVSNLIRPAQFGLTLDDDTRVSVRARPTRSRDGHVVLVIEDREPWGLLAFRVLWNDAPTQAFLIDQDVTASDCGYRREANTVHFDCAESGATLTAAIDMTTREISPITRTPRP